MNYFPQQLVSCHIRSFTKSPSCGRPFCSSVRGGIPRTRHQGVRRCEKIKTAPAKSMSFLCFATFAYFAPLRETGLSVHGLIHRFQALE